MRVGFGAPILLATAALFIVGDAAAAARSASWLPSRGPEGGPAFALAVSRSAPEIVYVGTERGVFRSVNGGRSWASAGLAGPPDRFGSATGVYSLAVDPRTPGTVYAGLNVRWGGTTDRRPVFKSTNGGRSWRPLGLRGQVVAISSTEPPTVYAATGGLGGTNRLFRSMDAGSNWQPADRGLPSTLGFPYQWALAFDPTAPATVYAAMGSRGVFKSSDGGRSWRTLGVSPSYRDVTAVAVDPRHPLTVYAGTDAGVVKRLDGGRSWRMVSSALGAHGRDRWYADVSALVVDPRDSRTVYAATICTGVFKSTDGGHRWSPANAGLEPKCARPYSIALDPLAPRSIYVADPSRGVFKSEGGARWHAANTGLSLSTVFSLAVGPQTVYAAAGGLGLFKSGDGGAHWGSLPTGPKLVDEVAVDPTNPRNLLAVAAGYGVVRSTDGGRTWAGSSFGASARGVGVVAIHGRAAYAGTFGSGLFGSSDGGRSWRKLDALAALGVRYVQALAIAPGHAGVVYAGSGSTTAPGLFKSTDGGNSWQSLTDGLDAGVDAIALDPRDPATVYVGSLGAEGSVFRSTDGGTSWQPADRGLPRLRVKTDGGKLITQTVGVTALVIDPERPSTLYAAAFRRGVYRSTDSGLNWRPLNAGLSSLDVRTLALDATGRTLYAGTAGGGVVSLHPKT